MRLQFKSGRAVTTIALAAAAGISACTSKDLLEAPNPSIIDPSSVHSAAGAIAVRNGALSALRGATADGESTWLFGGLLADEWQTSSTFIQNDETDQRSTQLNNATVNGDLRALYRVRTRANQAIVLLNTFVLPAPKPSDVAEMYFVRGFAELQLASDFCNGIPLSDGSGDAFVLGQPETVNTVFTVAAASLDTAITMTNGLTDAPSILVNRAARIARARALLGMGIANAGPAAALVAGIPTNFRYDVTASLTGGTNVLWDQPNNSSRYTVGDSVQPNIRTNRIQNAIPFLSAGDRRVPAHYKIASNGKDSVKSQDGGTFAITVDSLWGPSTAVAVASGIDARLIEAEAFLAATDPVNFMLTLNTLRGATQVITVSSPTASGTHPGWTTPVMAALVDPGNQAGRVALLFREKAFWQFGRGFRLGDLRNMIRNYPTLYAPDGSQNFPVGAHFKGGIYGADRNLPVTTDEQVGNPNFSLCLDRNA